MQFPFLSPLWWLRNREVFTLFNLFVVIGLRLVWRFLGLVANRPLA